MAYVDDPIKTIYKYDSYLEDLVKDIDKDKEFINRYYKGKKDNSIDYLFGIIKNILKRLFIVNFVGKYNELFTSDVLITIGTSILFFYGNMGLLKIGYDLFLYFYFLLLSFTILIIILNFSKMKGILTILLIFVSSIIFMNDSIYYASKENIYKEEYHKMIIDNDLNKTEFFLENIKQLNLFKQN